MKCFPTISVPLFLAHFNYTGRVIRSKTLHNTFLYVQAFQAKRPVQSNKIDQRNQQELTRRQKTLKAQKRTLVLI